MTTTNAWIKITANNLDSIVAIDLRRDAEEVLESDQDALIWHHKSSARAAAEVVYYPKWDQAGIVYNADAEWGDTIVRFDDLGAPFRFRLDLGENVLRLVDEHGVGRCCHDGCDAASAPEWVDDDGDWVCERHCAQNREYVELVAGEPNVLSDPARARRFCDEMAEHGWTVEVRAPRRGEAEGTYYQKGDGTLQILGYSILVPESYRLDSERAYEHACH